MLHSHGLPDLIMLIANDSSWCLRDPICVGIVKSFREPAGVAPAAVSQVPEARQRMSRGKVLPIVVPTVCL